MTSIDDEWQSYLNGSTSDDFQFKSIQQPDHTNKIEQTAPECQELYISTTTKVLYFNRPVDINEVFWKLPIIKYTSPENGIVKKQMKIVSKSPEEYELYKDKIKNLEYYQEHIIKQVHNPSARRLKFKDERKITVGMSKKDIMNCRGKVKNAFYNCFAIIIRFKYEEAFKEIHVKVFNTGKLEIPGVLNSGLLDKVKILIMKFMRNHFEGELKYIDEDLEQNVLINSNFNCGFYINRDILYKQLRSNVYNIETAYDPCSYPGVKCKFYYNNHNSHNIEDQKGLIDKCDRGMKTSELDDNKKYTEVSFMVFRTGSSLIVGNCTEKILRFVYDFIKNILKIEYQTIYVPPDNVPIKEKKEKLRKKIISIDT
tara:strand:+ start:523 stop:1629 length:1107 start_codon:yes stop_codon:yes gene_type:complete